MDYTTLKKMERYKIGGISVATERNRAVKQGREITRLLSNIEARLPQTISYTVLVTGADHTIGQFENLHRAYASLGKLISNLEFEVKNLEEAAAARRPSKPGDAR